jgi:hypothetical protein
LILFPYFDVMINWRVATLIGLENTVCKEYLIGRKETKMLERAFELQKKFVYKSKKSYMQAINEMK